MTRFPRFVPSSLELPWRRSVGVGALLVACWSMGVGCDPGSSADLSVTVGNNEDDSGGSSGAGGSGVPTAPSSDVDDLYELPPPPGCGDFELNADEACDDGDRENGDGCSANCLVIENGYECPEAGRDCVLAELCGDSLRIGSEQCDDGNAEGRDGCSSDCKLEAGFVCPELGEPCVSTVVCGDGVILGDERCDDGDLELGDGCTDTCELEDGWVCEVPGIRCTPICGDGLRRGSEQCDDGDLDAVVDGCSNTCRLQPGFVCEVEGEACRTSDCQDGLREGSEQCDDANDVPFDGCTAACVNEPRCNDAGGTYACTAVCGDGMKFPEEACDDGNTLADDGCSPTCTIEPGYDCTNAAAELGDQIVLPVILRDFQDNHPQFEVNPDPSGVLTPGMVLSELQTVEASPGVFRFVPGFNPAFSFDPDGGGGVTARAWTLDGRKPAIDGGAAPLATPAAISARFSEWFVTSAVNREVVSTLVLPELAGTPGTFQFAATGANQFFPLDGLGFGNQGRANNFHFTSETRQWFEYTGGEVLSFSGDDDVWVFVNGQLTVDLGGIHGELFGSITLDGESGEDSTICIGNPCTPQPFPVAMNPEGVNEIAVFQAERHVTQSNYTLTLRGFNAPVTSCTPVCNDGILTPDEICDNGENNGTDYGQCVRDLCIPGPRCGDGVINGPEACDNGVNRDPYLLQEGHCAAGCVIPSRCGDGAVNGDFGEQCDDGVNDNSYGGCSPECVLGPRCGDGSVNGPEECDDGNRRNNDGCNVNCVVERDPF